MPSYEGLAYDYTNTALRVEVVSGGGGGGLSVIDEATWTAGTSNFTPTGGFFNDSAAALTPGQQGTARLSRARAIGVYNDFPSSSTATWTSATTINTTLAQSIVGDGTVTVTSVETGTTTTAGALTFEVFDGTNWWAVDGQIIGSYTVQSSYTLVNGTNIAWQFDVGGFQQFRVRLSTAITGTGSPQVVLIMQVMGADNAITPTVGWGQKLDQTNDAITAYPFGHSYTNITTATTATVKSGAGVLNTIVVNTLVASATITIYDNTAGSGNKIGTITLPSTITGDDPVVIVYGGVAFSTGLTLVTSGATDISVGWR